jgi:hypothetical protein
MISLQSSSTVIENACLIAITIRLPRGNGATVKRGVWLGSSSTAPNVAMATRSVL